LQRASESLVTYGQEMDLKLDQMTNSRNAWRTVGIVGLTATAISILWLLAKVF
jgi:hypothetical protein